MGRKVLIVVVLASIPLVALGARLRLFQVRTSTGHIFDVMVESNMGLSNGLSDAYDGCYMLRVSNNEVRTPSATILFAGRGVRSPRIDVGDFQVTRKVYIPETGDWARYYDLIINNSRRVQTAEVEIYGNLGSDGGTKLMGTSDNDSTIETTDTWFATDDYADGSGDPSLAHVFRRVKGRLRPEQVTLERDNISIRFELRLPPRGKKALVIYAVQTNTSAKAQQIAEDLVKFGTDARAGLDPYDIRLIAN